MRKRLMIIACGAAAFLAACRLNPALSTAWVAWISRPALAALSRLSARVPFPAAEALAAMLVGFALFSLPCRRSFKRWCSSVTAVALALSGVLAILWFPACCAGGFTPPPRAGVPELEALCDSLLQALDGNIPRVDVAEAVALAADVAGQPHACVKCARWPEWMRAARLSGLFVPWTGEAVVDPGVPPILIPFTAVHELMHLSGVADEGAANVAAWTRCVDFGGSFTDSARLWALRYALIRLRSVDPRAARRVEAAMPPEARALCPDDLEPARPSIVARLLGIEAQTTDYDALVDWLAAHPEAW